MIEELGRILFEILAPVFALVFVGWLLAKRQGVEPTGLSRISYWVLGPAFMYDTLTRAELEASLIVRLVAGSMVVAALAGTVAAVLSVVTGRAPGVRRAATTTALYGNVGNFGLAIAVFAYGPDALPLAAIVMLTINLLGLVVGITGATSEDGSIWRAILRGLTAPMVLAVPLAVIVQVTDAAVPLAVTRPTALLAGALIPVMLVTLGVQLAGMDRFRLGIDVAIPSVVKLGLAPVAAIVVGMLLDLTGEPLGVLVIQSAMPTAVFAALVAIEHDHEAELTTSTVLATTLLSVVTLPIVLFVVLQAGII